MLDIHGWGLSCKSYMFKVRQAEILMDVCLDEEVTDIDSCSQGPYGSGWILFYKGAQLLQELWGPLLCC